MSEATEAPALQGFYMPAEWAPHARCWMAWPCRLDLWGAERYEDTCRAFAAVARAVAEFEPVHMLVPADQVAAATLQLARKAEIVVAELDDSWTRDTGPTFLVGPENRIGGVSWHFNGWGHRYHPHDKDDALAAWLLDLGGHEVFQGPMVLEGGAVDVDGTGTLLATETSILNANRNPTLDVSQVEERLAFYLGVSKIIWLPNGLLSDETDGHIDNVARFVRPGRVACAMASDNADPNRETLLENRRRLSEAVDSRGRPLEIVDIPLPSPSDGPMGPLPASYLNFYIANGAVFVPAFDQRTDETARALIAEQFPDREVVQLPAHDIVWGGGGIHCITQQECAAETA